MNSLFKFFNYIYFFIYIKICQTKVLFHGQIQDEFDHPVFYNFNTFADKLPYPMHMLSKWLLSLLHNWNLFLGLSLSGHYVKVIYIIHWVKPDFVSNFLKMNKLFVHFLLQNRWNKSDVLHNIKYSLYLMVTPKALFAIFLLKT